MSDHGVDYTQQVLERARQLQLEARRNATPRFGPAVDGVLWSRIRPGEEDEGPETLILGILEFTLKPGIDILDESRPPRRLWEAALRYVGSIPGCCAVEWGVRLDKFNHGGSGPTSLFCLVHWDSAAAWRKFQHSPGFTPIIGLLDSDVYVSNRCAKLGPLGATRLGSGSNAPGRDRATVVDVVSVAMAAEDASSPELRSAFEEAWNTLVALVTKGHDGLQHSYAVWLENNVVTFLDPTPAEAAPATRQAIFTAFLAWDGARYDSRHVEELCDRLRASLPSLQANRPTTVSRKAVQLVSETPQPEEHHGAPRQPAAQHNNLASILKASFPRQCSADLANLKEHGYQAVDRSIRDARARTRLFPAPRGSFRFQGELYEGNTPVIPHWRRSPAPFHGGYHCVDVVWMQLKARAPKKEGPRIFNQLKDQISALPGFVMASWACDVEHKAKLAVLTGQKTPNQSSKLLLRLLTCAVFLVWEDQHARGAASQDYRRILDVFAASSVHLLAPLKHQALLMPRCLGAPWLTDWRGPYMELISFYVPAGVVERQLFEHAYGAFIRFVTIYNIYIFTFPSLSQALSSLLLPNMNGPTY